jgi:hypothetical protein
VLTRVVLTPRHFQRLLSAGDGLFWNRAGETLYLRSTAFVSRQLVERAHRAALGSVETNRPGAREMYPDVSGSLERFEASIYAAWLAHRINWFETVVGDLQPILAEVSRTIQELAMTSRAERDAALAKRLAELEHQLKTRQDGDALQGYEAHADVRAPAEPEPPVTLSDLEQAFLESRHFGSSFVSDSSIHGAYGVSIDRAERLVTFVPAVFDAHPSSVSLLSYGSIPLQQLMAMIPDPSDAERRGLQRLSMRRPFPRVGYFALRDGEPRLVETAGQLRDLLQNDTSEAWTVEVATAARQTFHAVVLRDVERIGRQMRRMNDGAQASLADQARRLLIRAALIEIVQAQGVPGGLENDTTSFNERAVLGLARHGYPYTHLLAFLGNQVPAPDPLDHFYDEIVNASRESLSRQAVVIRQQAESLLGQLGPVQAAAPVDLTEQIVIEERYFSIP